MKIVPVKVPNVSFDKKYYISSCGDIYTDINGKNVIEKYISSNGFNYVRLIDSNGKYLMINIDLIMGYSFLSSERSAFGISACEIIHLNDDTYDDNVNNIKWVERIEEWRLINDPDIKPNRYMISSFGRVKNIISDKIIKGFISNEYVYVTLLSNDDTYVQRGINRLVASAFINGFSPWKNVVNHIDGYKTNNYWKNLEWCTFSENTRHAHYIGLITNNMGENSSSSKITMQIAQKIWLLLIDDKDALNGRPPTNGSPHMVYEYINNEYPEVSKAIISNIKKYKSWGGNTLFPSHDFTKFFIDENVVKRIWLLLIDDKDALNGRPPTNGNCSIVQKYLCEESICIPLHKIYSIKGRHAWKCVTDNLPKGSLTDNRKSINYTIAQKIWLLLIDDKDALNGRPPTNGSPHMVALYMKEEGFQNVTDGIIDSIKHGKAWNFVTGLKNRRSDK